jgi:hypothetical protein
MLEAKFIQAIFISKVAHSNTLTTNAGVGTIYSAHIKTISGGKINAVKSY